MAVFCIVFRVFRGKILAISRHIFLNSKVIPECIPKAESLKNRGPVFRDYAPALPE